MVVTTELINYLQNNPLHLKRNCHTNKEGKPYKDLQSAFRNYVRKDYLASFKIKNKTHGAIRKQVNGKVLQMKNKPNLKKLARKQIEEQSHGR